MPFFITTFSLPHFGFLYLLIAHGVEYNFGFNLTNSSIATPPISSFILPTFSMFE